MQKGWFNFCFFFLVLCLSSCSSVAVENVKLIDFGIRSISYDKLETTEDPNIERIKIVKSDHFIESTNRVPATIGTGFGIRFVVEGEPYGKVVTVEYAVQHPWLTNPHNGKTFMEYTYKRDVKIGEIKSTGYQFEEEWELAPGAWNFQILYQGRVMAEKTFIVYRPSPN